jgi:hypothetical protein
MIQLDYLDDQKKHSNGLASGWKLSASERSPKFEKFQNSFSDIEVASNRLDTRETPSGH